MTITPRENLRGVIQRLEGTWSVLFRTSLIPQNRASLDAKIPPGNPLQVTDSCPIDGLPTGERRIRLDARPPRVSRRRQANSEPTHDQANEVSS